MELKRNSNAVYLLNYHLILITKYRKKVFTNDNIIERTKEIMRNIAEDFDADIINQECGEDHIHLMISTKPTIELTKMINLLKGTSSRYIRKEFENESREKRAEFQRIEQRLNQKDEILSKKDANLLKRNEELQHEEKLLEKKQKEQNQGLSSSRNIDANLNKI